MTNRRQMSAMEQIGEIYERLKVLEAALAKPEGLAKKLPAGIVSSKEPIWNMTSSLGRSRPSLSA